MTARKHSGTALIFAIHRTEAWWRHIGDNLGYERSLLVSDLRGEGDLNVVDDFYAAYREYYRSAAASSDLLTADQLDDVIARCRVLRWLPSRKARAMALGMAEAFEKVLEAANPATIVSFPIDRYGKDILARLARRRGVPYYEFTASPLPGMAMLLYRGRLVKRQGEPDPALVEEKRAEIADPLFTPSYVQGKSIYNRSKFLKVFGYFRLRSHAFKAISLLKRDPLNLHYMDAQSWLGHKPHISDIRVTAMVEQDWRAKVETFPKDRRLFLGLQLFPEASIDYWIDDVELIQYEDLLMEAASSFAAAGFQILVKDHPLQFGFRQVALLDRLKALPNVVLVPYEVSGNELVSLCGTNFTCTGTLGLQSALLGLNSIVVENYYTTPGDFILMRSRADVADLPERVMEAPPPGALEERQRRIVANLLQGSFDADFFSFKDFDSKAPSPSVAALAQALGDEMACLGPDGEDWHGRQTALK